MRVIIIRTLSDVEDRISMLSKLADESLARIDFKRSSGLNSLYSLKFEPIGRHPINGHALNFVEQINQTWTYYCAFKACEKLFTLHPEVGEWMLAPGAHASQPLDIMSSANGSVGAETFAAVDPKNNKKLDKDIEKLKERPERHRYVFFLSPKFPNERRIEVRNGIEIWSLELGGREINR